MTLEFRDLSLAYRVPGGRFSAVEGIRALFPPGGLAAIVGPSGCGKTSLILAAAGLLAPESGEVRADGEPLTGVRGRTAVIFQDYGLLPWYTVERNAELPLRIRGISRAERAERVRPILREFGLDGFRHFYPGRLSGGMKQRVALARALVQEPDLLLMDEPFSSLDALTREAAQEFLLSVRIRRPFTVVLVTHSIEEAVYLADTVHVMTGRNPGRFTARFEIPENAPERRFREDRDPGASGGGGGRAAASARGSDFRESARYAELCRSVRSALRSSGAGDGAAPGALP